ncbi:DNA repair protein RadC [Agrilactobacillus composti DSM 18527 = JCM 14202]|nr:DNA repair protein RadC [Agrilactobacillus composti]GAF40577.1 DNA repair protein RadC [Agrilactobacillus composti DSM 18527 = JCM 14202]
MTHMQPRERIQTYGVTTLSDQELLMALLASGSRDQSVTTISDNVLKHFGSLANLQRASLADLCAVGGIGLAKAALIQSAIELGQRVNLAQTLRQGAILSCEDAGKWMVQHFRGSVQEHLVAIYLDTKNQIIDHRIIFKGSLNASVVHPREIFHTAVAVSCCRFIICHNHPSGDPTPSKNDITFSKRLAQCGEIMGIECLDHIIVGRANYVSLFAQDLV